MSLISLFKKAIRSRAGRTLTEMFLPPDGAVFMLHHVGDPDEQGIAANQHLKVSVSFLEDLIVSCRKKGYSFICMDELLSLLNGRKHFRKILSLTFDDGYKDNLIHALPLFHSYNVPFTVYAATSFLTNENFCWWDELERCILEKESILTPGGETLPCRTREEKEQIFLLLRTFFLSVESSQLFRVFYNFLDANNCCVVAKSAGTNMVSRDDLTQYKDDPYLTWGCHSHSHISFAHQSMDLLDRDLTESLSVFAQCGVRPRHFAYPYGDDLTSSPALENLLERHGFLSAVSTKPDLIFCKNISNPYFIPRLFVSQFHSLTGLEGDMAALALRGKLRFICEK